MRASGKVGSSFDFRVIHTEHAIVDENKLPLISVDLAEIELLVGIYGNEGRVGWKMPESIRGKIRSLSKQ